MMLESAFQSSTNTPLTLQMRAPMILSEFWRLFKSKGHNLTAVEIAHIEGFSKGFEIGLMLSHEVTDKVKSKIKEDALTEALDRMKKK